MAQAVVYEVNLELNRDIADQYIAWLKPHIQEIISLPGFVSAELMAREEEKADPGAFSIALPCRAVRVCPC